MIPTEMWEIMINIFHDQMIYNAFKCKVKSIQVRSLLTNIMQSDHFCNDEKGMRSVEQTHLLHFFTALKQGKDQADPNYSVIT